MVEPEKDKTKTVIKLLEDARNILMEVMVRKEDIPRLKQLVKQIWLEIDPKDLEIISMLEKTTDMKDICRPIGTISSLMLKQGDYIEVVVKGRYEKAVRGKFKCLNTTYGDIVIETGEGEEVSVRIQGVKMIKKKT